MANAFYTLPLIPRPFASGGQAQAPIPENATGTNRASWQEGWPEITSTPVSEGGRPPVRLDFNGAIQALSAFAYALQNGQYFTFNQAVSDKIGGYPKGAVLWASVNGQPAYLVASVMDNNTNSNLTDTTAWQPLTINPYGFAMLGTLTDVQAAQVRNIAIVEEEPETGIDGTIYAIIESSGE